MTHVTPLALRRNGVEVLMTDLQVPTDEFAYGHSKIFIRNPRTVQIRLGTTHFSSSLWPFCIQKNSFLTETCLQQRVGCTWRAPLPLSTSAISM